MNGTAIRIETPLSEVTAIKYVKGRTISAYFDAAHFPKSAPIVCVLNGKPLMRAEWGRVVKHKDDVRFVIMPRGAIGNLLGSLAGAAIGFLVGGPLGAVIGFVATNAILNVLFPPQVGKGPEQPSPTYSIGAQGNTARLLQPIPKGYGLHNMYPDFASQPYSTFEGNDQYLYQLFCLGLGEYEVATVRIQETPVWHASTGYTDSFEDVTIEIVPPGVPVTLFPAAVQTSAEISGADLEPNNTLGPFIANTANTSVNRLQVDFVFTRGLYEMNDKGKLRNRSVTVHVEAQAIDNTGTAAGPWVTLGTPTYTRATSTPQRFSENYPVELGRYQVRVTRTSPQNTDDSKIADTVQWAGLRAFEPSDNTYENVTLLAVKIRATNQLSQQSSRLFNVIQTAKVPVWNGVAWTAPQPTRSIAWAVADMLRNPVYGEGRADSAIDLAKLRQLDATWFARGDTFNGVFDTKRTFWESLGLALAAGRAQPQLIGGIVTFMRDEPRMLAKGVFTPHNIRAGTFETTHILYDENTADDVIVEYQDERTWKTNEVQCSLDGSTSDNPARIQLFGVTNYAHAWREGVYQAAANSYRRIVGGLQAEMEGKLLVRGDAAVVSHDMTKWGMAGEVVAYDPATRSVYMSEPATWTNGPFMLTASDRRNRQWGPVVVTRGSDDAHAIFDADSLHAVEVEMGKFADIVVTDPNMIVTRYIHGSTVQYAKRFIVTNSQPQSQTAISVGLLNDDPRVYTADAGDPPPEEGTSNGPGTSPAAPVVVGLNLAIDPGSTGNPVTFNASWQPAGGATGYVAQISYDGASWETVYEGTNTAINFVAQANTINLRVAAIGSIRGPWTYFVEDYTDFDTAPLPIDDLRVYTGANNAQVTAYWSSTLRATSYVVELYVDGEKVVSSETAGNSILFSELTITQVGGPWPSFEVRVSAKNNVGLSDPAVHVVSGGTVVSSPTELAVSTDDPAIISVRAPYDNSWYYVRLYKGTTNDFGAAMQIGMDYVGAPGQVFSFTDTGAAGTARYFAEAFNSAGDASAPVGPVQAGASSGGGGGGGGSGGGGGGCPDEAEPILLANADRNGPGERVPAGAILPGVHYVWTRHEHTGEWGAFLVTKARKFPATLYKAEGHPRTTALHRFRHDGGEWYRMRDIGVQDGRGIAVELAVQHAHTYVAGNRDEVLSHNLKQVEV